MTRFIVLSEPRSGSTMLISLLRQHSSIHCDGELLNDEYGRKEDVLGFLEDHMSQFDHPRVGFKLFPEQMIFHCITLFELVRRLHVKWIIVNWRKSILETLLSMRVAKRTNRWCSEEPAVNIETEDISNDDVRSLINQTEEHWRYAAKGWPADVIPLFVNYEELTESTTDVIQRLLLNISLDPVDVINEPWSKRQNPAPLHLKVPTLPLLSYDSKTSVNIPEIVDNAILNELGIRKEFIVLLPDREPPVPPRGWKYKVAEPYMPEAVRNNVLDAVDSRNVSSANIWITKLANKLKAIFHVPVAQPCCNGFAALVLALQVAGIRPGDEIIVPTFTMIAVANAIDFVGATPVLVDNAAGEYNPGLHEVQAAASTRTKAVIITHTYGVPAKDLDAILETCNKNSWFLIEDISECTGIMTVSSAGSNRLLGTCGHFACASMYANKLLHAGDGGFVLAKNSRHAYALGSLVNHGFTGSYHFVHLRKAGNFKMSGLSAAMACASLDSMDEVMRHRSAMSSTYRRCLSSTPLVMMPACGPFDTPWVFGVLCESKVQRKEVRELLAKYGVETRNYFFPLHAQPAYSNLHKQPPNCPNAEFLAKCGFYLPSFTRLCDIDIEWICAVICSYFDTTPTTFANSSPKDNSLKSVRVNQRTLELVVREFDNAGNRLTKTDNHPLWTSIVIIHESMKTHVQTERWDDGQLLKQKMSDALKDNKLQDIPGAETKLRSYHEYIQSQESFENEISEPWANEDIYSNDFAYCHQVKTMTKHNVFRMLCWFIRTRHAKTILEVGTLLGGSTSFMATAARQVSKDARVVTVDNFVWAHWMNRFFTEHCLSPGDSFLDLFTHHTKSVSNIVHVVKWNIGGEPFPRDKFFGFCFDIAYLDLTQFVSEDNFQLLNLWNNIKSHFISGKTVVVFDSLNKGILSFVTQTKELTPLAKPTQTMAKAFLYTKHTNSNGISNDLTRGMMLERRLCFLQSPDWSHHYKNAFNEAITVLYKRLHSPDAPVDFIPALAQFLCDCSHVIKRPWIGIIHGVEKDDSFYPPDLERLCSKRYYHVLLLCQGLFTLTEFQAAYLRRNLPRGLNIPICTLKLPTVAPSQFVNKDIIANCTSLNVLLVGSFGRDFELFFTIRLPRGCQKLLIAGDANSQEWSLKAPADVIVVERMDDNEYENLLCRSIVFLPLKYEGAANTIIVECIGRNVPIVAPRNETCKEYLGAGYPLLYDAGCLNLTDLLTSDNIASAIHYLETYDKTMFRVESFCAAIEKSTVLSSIAPQDDHIQRMIYRFDVAVLVCSYKRTHHLQSILESLLNQQEFIGSIQVIVWNNNYSRYGVVNEICKPFIIKNTLKRSLTLISSTANHYCIVRACMTHLMQSDVLLICDDDVIPRSRFIEFFMDAHNRHPNDLIGVRGHRFLPHVLDQDNPSQNWFDRNKTRFVDDKEPEQLIHFIHADVCLVTQSALREFSSVPLPDGSFALVDDYWMCFVLNQCFGRNLRKLQCASGTHFERTFDSETPGLALFTRSEVKDARIRMYIHHMIRGWPNWDDEKNQLPCPTEVAEYKRNFWQDPNCLFFGVNISNCISEQDLVDLLRLGVRTVRVGAVSSKESFTDMSIFAGNPNLLLSELIAVIGLLNKFDMNAIITLQHDVASPELWGLIAAEFSGEKNVIGYDLLNEPHTDDELHLHSSELNQTCANGITKYIDMVVSYIQIIRRSDSNTPIIVEPTYWASIHALNSLSPFIRTLQAVDSQIVFSVHFYNPHKLTNRRLNANRYAYPGKVPNFNGNDIEMEEWNDHKIMQVLSDVKKWQSENGVALFVGEFGISRETPGACEYLKAVGRACLANGLSCILYSFREETWDAMNYELGPLLHATISRTPVPLEQNCLMKAVQEIVSMYVKVS